MAQYSKKVRNCADFRKFMADFGLNRHAVCAEVTCKKGGGNFSVQRSKKTWARMQLAKHCSLHLQARLALQAKVGKFAKICPSERNYQEFAHLATSNDFFLLLGETAMKIMP